VSKGLHLHADRLSYTNPIFGCEAKPGRAILPGTIHLRRNPESFGAPCNARTRNQKGFTVIEMVVSVSLIWMLATIAVPSINHLILQYRVKDAAREIASSLQLLRLRAVSTNNRAYLHFIPPGTSLADGFYTALVDADNNPDDITPAETEATQLRLSDTLAGYKGKRLPSGVSYGWGSGVNKNTQGDPLPTNAVTFSGDRARFSPDGAALAGSVYLKNTLDESYVVTVAITGRVKIWRWNGSRWG